MRARELEDMTPEDQQRANLYRKALGHLVRQDLKYMSNMRTFDRWDLATQIWWINMIEQQAKNGLNTVGTDVVAAAITVRLDGTK